MIETECPGEELPEQCTRTDEVAGSIVLHVGHDMSEKENNIEEADEAAERRQTSTHRGQCGSGNRHHRTLGNQTNPEVHQFALIP